MKNILQNILAFIAGVFIGGSVNMGIIMISDSVIALPEGIEPGNMESLVANFHLFEPINLLMPFLAHALGALAGAFIAAKIAATYKVQFALSIGFIFLLGGIQMATLLPAPLWFDIADLGFAYIPMAYLGYRLAK
jgi:hypothetical protein